MLFCQKCGALMRPKVEKGKKVLGCACGHTRKVAESKIKEVVGKPRSTFDVVSEEDTTLPMTEAHCPECGHDQAYWWTKQMRASDEPETKFLRCGKCKNTWRDAS